MQGFHSLDSAAETLVLLGIVVLEADLELHGLEEVALLLLRLGEQLIDALVENVLRNFRPKIEKFIRECLMIWQCSELLVIASAVRAVRR